MFFLNVFESFEPSLYQLAPYGVNEMTQFEIVCKAINITPTIAYLGSFYVLPKMMTGLPFRNKQTLFPIVCFKGIRNLRVGKTIFFRVVSLVASFEMPKRSSKGPFWKCRLIDPSFNRDHYNPMCSNLTHMLAFHEEVLVLVGLNGV